MWCNLQNRFAMSMLLVLVNYMTTSGKQQPSTLRNLETNYPSLYVEHHLHNMSRCIAVCIGKHFCCARETTCQDKMNHHEHFSSQKYPAKPEIREWLPCVDPGTGRPLSRSSRLATHCPCCIPVPSPALCYTSTATTAASQLQSRMRAGVPIANNKPVRKNTFLTN